MNGDLAEVGRPDLGRSALAFADTDRTTGRLLSVAELQRALQLVRDGHPTADPDASVTVAVTSPDELLAAPVAAQLPAGSLAGVSVVVLAACGGSGTSTVALAVAEAAAATPGTVARLIETVGPGSSGFVAAVSSPAVKRKSSAPSVTA